MVFPLIFKDQLESTRQEKKTKKWIIKRFLRSLYKHNFFLLLLLNFFLDPYCYKS